MERVDESAGLANAVAAMSPDAILPGRHPSPATLDAFVTAARGLKQAEDALIAARTAYAEAVKALSEEAVR